MTTKSERLTVLSDAEQEALYGLPDFARRPQIQERLTGQIAEALKYILETDDVAVVMRAQHFCVLTRGVEDADSNTTTSSLHGRFMAEASLRSELMSLVNKG
jgi:GTP cyclohydrolase I